VTLNALASYGVQAPVDRTYRPYPYWTQDAFVHSECVASNCTAPCELAQAARAMDCVPGVASRAYHADELGSPKALAELLVKSLAAPGTFVVA
jgi:hypothetical protein